MPTIDLVTEAYELQIDSAATGVISKLHFGSESERFSRLEKERNDFLLKRTPFSYALSTNRTIGDTPFQVMLRAHDNTVLTESSMAPLECCSRMPQQRSTEFYLL